MKLTLITHRDSMPTNIKKAQILDLNFLIM